MLVRGVPVNVPRREVCVLLALEPADRIDRRDRHLGWLSLALAAVLEPWLAELPVLLP
jgi:hypothetical protein